MLNTPVGGHARLFSGVNVSKCSASRLSVGSVFGTNPLLISEATLPRMLRREKVCHLFGISDIIAKLSVVF